MARCLDEYPWGELLGVTARLACVSSVDAVQAGMVSTPLGRVVAFEPFGTPWG